MWLACPLRCRARDERLRLLERGLDLPWTTPRLWPDGDGPLEAMLSQAQFVLWSDYSAETRDRLRGNLWPDTPAELRRRGHTIEARARTALEREADAFVVRESLVTPDGMTVRLLERR